MSKFLILDKKLFFISEIIRDTLMTGGCSLSQVQKTVANTFLQFLMKNQPQYLQALQEKFTPKLPGCGVQA